jgi:hypothetical protein
MRKRLIRVKYDAALRRLVSRRDRACRELYALGNYGTLNDDGSITEKAWAILEEYFLARVQLEFLAGPHDVPEHTGSEFNKDDVDDFIQQIGSVDGSEDLPQEVYEALEEEVERRKKHAAEEEESERLSRVAKAKREELKASAS